MMKFLKNEIINETNVSSIRQRYLENIKWQNENYGAVESWVLTNIKLSKNEMKNYNSCLDIHNMKEHSIKTKKRKFCETLIK